MDYTKGYTASFYATVVDPESWRDMEMIGIKSGSIKRESTGLRQSAELTVKDFPEIEERYIRIYMDAEQNGDIAHVPLFTGLASAPEKDIDGAIIERPLQVYSVLEPLEGIKLPRGFYLTAGMAVASAVKLLFQGLRAPYTITAESPLIMDYIVAEDNESCLSMTDKVLDACGWRMWVDGSGHIFIGPPATEAEISMSPAQDIVERVVKVKHDWFDCPNVLRASTGDAVAIERDDSPDSLLSTVNRGREVIVNESNVTLASDEGIAEYAKRRLKELQESVETAEYVRRFRPDLNIGSIISLDYDQIRGQYAVTSQTIQLTHNAETTETVSRDFSYIRGEDIVPEVQMARVVMPDDYYVVFPDGARLCVPIKTISTN